MLPLPEQIKRFSFNYLSVELRQFATIDSTNTYLKNYVREIEQDAIEGICALADKQTAGRGRMARQWHSPSGAGCYLSILLKPQLAIDQIPLITLMAAIVVQETVKQYCALTSDIKWPNDLLINGSKIAGILTETGFENGALKFLVLGIGVNLNHSFFPEELTYSATSIFLQTGINIDRDQFVYQLLKNLDQWYQQLHRAPQTIITKWQHSSSYAYGKKIYIEHNNEKLLVETCGLTENGALRVSCNTRPNANSEIILYGGEIVTVEEGS